MTIISRNLQLLSVKSRAKSSAFKVWQITVKSQIFSTIDMQFCIFCFHIKLIHEEESNTFH